MWRGVVWWTTVWPGRVSLTDWQTGVISLLATLQCCQRMRSGCGVGCTVHCTVSLSANTLCNYQLISCHMCSIILSYYTIFLTIYLTILSLLSLYCLYSLQCTVIWGRGSMLHVSFSCVQIYDYTQKKSPISVIYCLCHINSLKYD